MTYPYILILNQFSMFLYKKAGKYKVTYELLANVSKSLKMYVSQTQNTNLWLPKEKLREGINQEFQITHYKHITMNCYKINNKHFLYHIGNYIQ